MQVPSEITARLGGATPRFEDQYVYKAEVNALGALTSDTDAIQFEADVYFVITKMSYFANIAGAAQTESSRVVPLVRCLISDTGSGRNLMSGAVDISSLAGHEGLPFVTPTQRWVVPSSVINVQFNNYSAVTLYDTVSLYFHGIKVWF